MKKDTLINFTAKLYFWNNAKKIEDERCHNFHVKNIKPNKIPTVIKYQAMPNHDWDTVPEVEMKLYNSKLYRAVSKLDYFSTVDKDLGYFAQQINVSLDQKQVKTNYDEETLSKIMQDFKKRCQIVQKVIDNSMVVSEGKIYLTARMPHYEICLDTVDHQLSNVFVDVTSIPAVNKKFAYNANEYKKVYQQALKIAKENHLVNTTKKIKKALDSKETKTYIHVYDENLITNYPDKNTWYAEELIDSINNEEDDLPF